MGCGCGLMNPYEECAFLLKDFNKLVLKRKDFMNKKMIKEKRKTDKKASNYRIKIYKNLENINKNNLTKIESQKLKHLNDLFLVLLTEESNINKNDNIEEIEMNNNDEILIMNTNKINKANLYPNDITKNKAHVNLISN